MRQTRFAPKESRWLTQPSGVMAEMNIERAFPGALSALCSVTVSIHGAKSRISFSSSVSV